jgi:S-(hydroxymethyl)glutathione dehydrogenase / alcohol dehydrogenase
MTRAAGTACIVGMAPQASRATFDPLALVTKETRLIGTWYGSARPRIDFRRMVELTVAGKVKELISRRYTLDEINDGFDRLGRGEVARGVIVF